MCDTSVRTCIKSIAYRRPTRGVGPADNSAVKEILLEKHLPLCYYIPINQNNEKMQVIQHLFIKLFSKKIGNDEFGNAYYENSEKRRFIVYKGCPEPSKIPAQWHGWIHYNTDVAPVNIKTNKFSWQKIHLPNLTGTKHAYKPKDTIGKAKRYQSWQPK